uniref:Neuroguidin n=1 Tax=Petromyzon marinus TaxID=7757 RepID=S4RIA6_PETMA
FCVQAYPDKDVKEALSLLKSLKEQVTSVTSHIQGLRNKCTSEDFDMSKGLSLLDVKNQMLLTYLMDLTFVMLKKVEGQTLVNEPAIFRLVEVRTVLEKMRPVEQKLRYQIDKLVKTTLTGSMGENNPLRFKPNPDNMVSKLGDENDEDGEEDDKTTKEDEKKQNRYVPPHIAAMPYTADQDDTEADRQRKRLVDARRRALSSSVIRELHEEYSEAPEEIRDGYNMHRMRHSREDQHRKEYEEAMMVRLNVPKKEQQKRKRALAMTSQLDSLTHFGDISALTRDQTLGEDEDERPHKKKKKVLKKKGKKGFRRRH